MEIEDIRKLCVYNMPEGVDLTHMDPELMDEINRHINHPIFITRNHIYTRDELMSLYPLEALGLKPEELFVRQVLGTYRSETAKEHVSINIGESFTWHPEAIHSNIYLARDAWEDFQTMQKVARGFARFGNSEFMDKFVSVEKPKLQIDNI